MGWLPIDERPSAMPRCDSAERLVIGWFQHNVKGPSFA